ncbi:hypothetical protein K040078D81_45330 [Blautia hominis]|uniref:Cyclic lactone autoinducer peptide n=1 Tax=Blautia hominis TaxID=2025493 RepID=A0ABQ0BG32_9FIRM
MYQLAVLLSRNRMCKKIIKKQKFPEDSNIGVCNFFSRSKGS